MKRLGNPLILHGVVGGVLAGLVVALWFLVVDSIAGRPFHTPAVLASALTRYEAAGPTFRMVATYTVVHFAVFACLGAGVAGAITALGTPPRLVFGVLFGLGAQELVFYTGLSLSGVSGVAVVPWPHVMAANVLSGLVLMTYLHRASREVGRFGLAGVKDHPLLARGLITGLVGAAAVAVWFFALDVVTGHPLRTPAALGSALLLGASNVGEVQLNLGVVAAYTVVHVVAFAVAGIGLVAIAEQVERAPALLLLVAMAGIVLEAVVVAGLGFGAQWVLGALGLWSVLGANVLAVGSMGAQVWATHPLLRRRLREEPIHVRV
jgi:hypothetical protein